MDVCYGATSNDGFDIGSGARIIAADETLEGMGAEGMLGGATTGESSAGVTIFKNGGTNAVEFRTAGVVELSGVELFARADDSLAGGPRSVDRFSFYADVDRDGVFETKLVDRAWPRNDGSANSYRFPVVTSSVFKAEFTSGWTSDDDRQGPRVLELDAILASNSGTVVFPLIGAVAIASALAILTVVTNRWLKHG